jgi:hypothetical protein
MPPPKNPTVAAAQVVWLGIEKGRRGETLLYKLVILSSFFDEYSIRI